MPQSYDYDEANETWPFFLLTVVLMVVVPLTIRQVYELFAAPNKEEDKNGDTLDSLKELSEIYATEDVKLFRKAFESSKKSALFNKKTLVILGGWAFVAFLIGRIAGNEAIQQSVVNAFDPYELLGVSSSASDREIKSAYRKLSVKFHPDKISRDVSKKEQTRMEEMYVQITKAYEALTDELTRQNFLKYGHPDGPQSSSHGIALPKFLVDGSASSIMVILYVAFLSVILPYLVSRWWSRTQSYTKKGIHTKTASHFVDRLINYKPSEIVTVGLIVKWLSEAEEFKLFYPHLSASDFERLLHDHLNRKHSTSGEAKIKYRIVAKCHSLLHGLLDISCGFRNVEVANMTIETFKCIVQAVPTPKYGQILQLPNVDKQKFLDGTVDDIETIGKLFTFNDEKIGKILGIDNKVKLQQTLNVASNIPFLKVLKAEFKVPGENVVTPSSLPHISLKVLVHSAKHKSIPVERFPQSMLDEAQDFDTQRDPFSVMSNQPLIPHSFAPMFPASRRSVWCCLVSMQKDNKLIQTPILADRLSFKNLRNALDKRIVKELNDKNFNAEDWDIGTIKIPLGQPAPAEKGETYFRVMIKSTDYFGPDLDFTMCLQVRDLPEVEKLEDIYGDDEEDDEESANEDSDGNEESDESDYTDINTDTEEED